MTTGRTPSDPADAEIRFERAGRLAVVTLDRPRALNALTLGMIRQLDPALASWAHDHTVEAVVVRGAGEKAFCAGGDVRAVYEAGRRGTDVLTYEFFFEEYRLNRRIHRFPKPYLSLIDGIAMGGGLGLSVHGRYRVVTERTTMAMPETAIGLFPDVGGSWFLDRAPGRLGTYLALTGARIKAADAIHCGLATHFVASTDIPALLDTLAHTSPEAALHRYAGDPGPAPLAALQPRIDRAFAPSRMPRSSPPWKRKARGAPRWRPTCCADRRPVSRRRCGSCGGITVTRWRIVCAANSASCSASWRAMTSTRASAPSWSTRTMRQNGGRRTWTRSPTATSTRCSRRSTAAN